MHASRPRRKGTRLMLADINGETQSVCQMKDLNEKSSCFCQWTNSVLSILVLAKTHQSRCYRYAIVRVKFHLSKCVHQARFRRSLYGDHFDEYAPSPTWSFLLSCFPSWYAWKDVRWFASCSRVAIEQIQFAPGHGSALPEPFAVGWPRPSRRIRWVFRR